MATKQRFSNPVVGDDVVLKLFSFRSNNRTNFNAVDKVEIYFLDPEEVTEENPEGRRLVETLTGASIVNVETGLYQVTLTLSDTKYTIGDYVDVWYAYIEANDDLSTVENTWMIYPDLFYTSPLPIVHDFSFAFRPNKLRLGSKQYIIIDITPNVTNASDLARYYENIAIVSPLKISIEQVCGDCLPAEEDLRIIADEVDVELREKGRGYYFLDTEELTTGLYDIWFTMEFGGNTYVSSKQQLQLY
jgi:hypothetical protein